MRDSEKRAKSSEKLERYPGKFRRDWRDITDLASVYKRDKRRNVGRLRTSGIVSRLVIGGAASRKKARKEYVPRGRKNEKRRGDDRRKRRKTERRERKFKDRTSPTTVLRISGRARFTARVFRTSPFHPLPGFLLSERLVVLSFSADRGERLLRDARGTIRSYRGIISAAGRINSLKCASRCVSAFPITNLKRDAPSSSASTSLSSTYARLRRPSHPPPPSRLRRNISIFTSTTLPARAMGCMPVAACNCSCVSRLERRKKKGEKKQKRPTP